MFNSFQLIVYILFFVFAVGFSLLINKLFLSYAINFAAAEDQSERWNKEQKPTLGGISFYIIFLFSIALYPIVFDAPDFFDKEVVSILLSVSFGFLLGLADDVYGTNPFLKFLGQFLCANILLAANIVISLTPFDTVNYIVTLFWVIGLMNSINMLDNMDGIAASTSWVTIVGAIVLLFLQGTHTSIFILILIGALGALSGFLYFNIHPARMFMGDTGSQFLSVLLSAISILFFWKFRDSHQNFIDTKQFMLPLLFFIMPLIDTLTVTIRRILHGESPFVGGKDHTTHHLAYLGIPQRTVMFIFWGISLISSTLAIFVFLNIDTWNIWYSLLIFLYFVILFTIFQILYDKGDTKSSLQTKHK